MTAKRVLAALLAALTLFSCAACSETDAPEKETTASAAAEEVTTPAVTATTVDPNAPLDNLPADLKFSGMTFRTNTGTLTAANALGATRRSLFSKGNYLFEAMLVADLITDEMREFENEYGVLPLPKSMRSRRNTTPLLTAAPIF